MTSSQMKKILQENYKTYKSFLDANRFYYDIEWEDYHQLSRALQCKDINLSKLLILGGARINRNNDCRPLHLAIKLGCPEIVKMLLDNGAITHSRDVNGETPLIVAAKMQQFSIVDLLLSSTNLQNQSNIENLTHMHIACMRNRVDIMKKFTQTGSYLNYRVQHFSVNWQGYTVLHFAVQYQSVEAVKFLLESGVDITVINAAGYTPLHLAHIIRNEKIIDLILLYNCCLKDNSVHFDSNLSHFHIACTRNNAHVVETFIKWGANVNEPTNQGKAPITFAIEYECMDVIKLLLAYGAHISLEESSYNNIRLAFNTANEAIINLLQYRMVISKNHNYNYNEYFIEYDLTTLRSVTMLLKHLYGSNHLITPLYLAINNNKHDSENVDQVIRKLIAKNSYDLVKKSYFSGNTPVHIVFIRQQEYLLDSILLNYKHFNDNPVNENGLSLFHIACTRDHPHIVKKFLDSKALDINAQVNLDSPFWPKYTALHFAVACLCPQVVCLLLKKGANIELKNKDDESVLDIAIIDLERKFFSNGDDVDDTNDDVIDGVIDDDDNDDGDYNDDIDDNHDDDDDDDDDNIELKNKEDKSISHTTPIDLERKFISKSEKYVFGKTIAIIIFYILKNVQSRNSSLNTRGFTFLHVLCMINDENAIKEFLDSHLNLINQPVNWKEVSCHGCTALHFAVIFGHKDVLSLLLDHGADVSIKNIDGDTPLHCAYLRNKCSLISTEMILTPSNPVNKNGISHFHIACSIGNLEAVQYYLDIGVNVNQSTCYVKSTGSSVLHLACKNPNIDIEIIRLLLANQAKVNAKDAECNTPLHLAGCREDVTKILLTYGADANAVNLYGQTSLHKIIIEDFIYKSDHYKIVELLLEYGADVFATMEDGQTPLEMYEFICSFELSDSMINCIIVLMKHFVKLKHICDYEMSDKERKFIDAFKYDSKIVKLYKEFKFRDECRHERDLLSHIWIDKNNSLFDMLIRNLNQLSVHCQNSRFRRQIKFPIRLQLKYPIFGQLLKIQFDRGVERRRLFEKARVALSWLMMDSKLRTMPSICSEMIFLRASNDELRSVIKAAKII